jgi:hypothetical protein
MKSKDEYIVFNYTDNITASPNTFSSKDKARAFIKEFRSRYKKQGYYFTSGMERISPSDIELEIIPAKDLGKVFSGGWE